MLEQLPLEIVDDIIEYLDFEDVRSIARVCSAFRVLAQRRLFRTIQFAPNVSKVFPNYIESILSSPYLLQYTSHLVIHCFNTIQEISLPSLWSHLPIMYRLRNMDIYLELNDCLRMLSAPECLGLAREITLSLSCNLAPDLLISDDPLPVHALELWVDASNHQLTTRLVQKCSQSLRKLQLSIAKNTIPPLPFLPHLDELSLFTKLHDRGSDPDLLSLFPFLDQHPTITRISLGSEFTLAVQPPPNLLPNLQFLSATPAIIERLLPGRPVNDIYAKYISRSTRRFPDDIMLQSLRQPFVPVTALAIRTDSHFYNEDPANIVQALPNLREFTLEWPCFEFQRLLAALGRCKDMVHIQIYPSVDGDRSGLVGPLWSKGNFVQMVQRVQENGAAGLWSFELQAVVSGRQEGCEALRIGWLDAPRQPTLRGEWNFDIYGSSSESDIPISTCDASLETEIGGHSCSVSNM